MTQKKIKIPAIISDKDGVIQIGSRKIKGAHEIIKFLQQPLEKLNPVKFKGIKEKIPFLICSNGGGNLEEVFINNINNVLELKDTDRLTKDQIVCNFTPLRPILQSYRDKLILAAGILDIRNILKDCGNELYLTVEEYRFLYRNQFVSHDREPLFDMDKFKAGIRKRLHLRNDFDFDKEQLHIQAVFILSEQVNWEESLQIICDLCLTEDGKLPNEFPVNRKNSQKHIPIYSVNDDLLYPDHFRLPRMAQGSFNVVLQNTAKTLYDIDLQINRYGKPYDAAFQYMKKKAQELTNLEISNYYLIGDNPQSDILGANNNGFDSILVKTGVYQSDQNCSEIPGKYFVEDITAAVNLILKIEQII